MRTERVDTDFPSVMLADERAEEQSATWRLVTTTSSRNYRTAVKDLTDLDPGKVLKRARRRRRISLEQAAYATKISRRYLEALERNAPASELPARAYARGFLRAYVSFLRIPNSAELLERFEAAREQQAPVTLAAVLPPMSPPRRFGSRSIAIAIAAVLSVWLVAATDGPRPVRTPGPVALGLQQQPSAAEPESSAQVVPAPADLRDGRSAVVPLAVTVGVSDHASWLKILVDGKPVLERVVRAPFEQAFTGEHSIELVVGNAGVVKLSIGGVWSQPLGRPGEVRRVHVTAPDGVPVIS